MAKNISRLQEGTYDFDGLKVYLDANNLSHDVGIFEGNFLKHF